MCNNRADGFGKVRPTRECGPNGRKPNEEFQMRNTTFISSMVLSVACVSAANADYVLQTFTGSASASASVSRATADAGFQTGGFSLNYNAIAGGANTMAVDLYNEATGQTKTDVAYVPSLSGGNITQANPTTAVNKGQYSAGYTEGTGGNTKYYKNYYGGYSTSAPFTANQNYRAWDVNGTVGAQVQSSVINFSSTSTVDAGIADWTKVRYTNSSYTTVHSVNVQQRSDSASSVVTAGGSTMAYSAVSGQSMDLSTSTGFTGIQLKGSGTAWATQGSVEFRFIDVTDTFSWVVFNLGANESMGDFTVTAADLLAANASLDLSQIKYFSIDFYDGQNIATGSGATSYNGGFSYNASQVNLLGYAPVPAPGAIALLGAAGLIGARRRRD